MLLRRGSHSGSRGVSEDTRLVQVIDAQTTRISHLVQTLLDVSQVRAGALELTSAPINLGPLVSEVVRDIQVVAPRHTFEVTVEGQPLVGADRQRVRSILFHLLENAVKYSPRGGAIEVTVRPHGDEVVVGVRDHGIGIPREKQAQLFQAFYQVSPMVQPTTGMGLGLYFSRELVRRHGGQIWFESEEGQGSTFYFSLPTG
jgi:signal transduction histidine kinase